MAGRKTGFSDFILGAEQDNQTIVKPYGVALFQGKIYAVDTRGPGYVIIDLVNNEFRTVFGNAGGMMKKPINITIDSDGTKYVTDTGRNQVLLYDADDQFIQAFGVEGQFKPGDTAIDGKKLFISDLQDHEIEVVDKITGQLLYKIGSFESMDDERIKEEGVYYPTNLEIKDNFLYVSETGNFRIKKYTLDGQFVMNYGDIGVNFGNFVRPKGISLDREGRMYIVDSAFENVQILDTEGNILLFFGGPGNNPENLNLPVDVAIDYDNVQLFKQYAHPNFDLEYVILVSSQFGISKISVFGFGKMQDMTYP